MPTPHVPSRFKPATQGYSVGAPSGVYMNEVAGGMPRMGLDWNQGWQSVSVSRVMSKSEYAVWSVFFHRRINNGSIQFLMPLNLGQGMADHLCVMVPGSYTALQLSGNRVWSVAFTVLAQNPIYDMTEDQVQGLLDLWDLYGDEASPLLERIAKFALEDAKVLGP